MVVSEFVAGLSLVVLDGVVEGGTIVRTERRAFQPDFGRGGTAMAPGPMQAVGDLPGGFEIGDGPLLWTVVENRLVLSAFFHGTVFGLTTAIVRRRARW